MINIQNVDMFKECTVTDSTVQNVIDFLLSNVKEDYYFTFYDWRTKLKMKGMLDESNNDGGTKVAFMKILRYAHLNKIFDEKFWDVLFTERCYPTEAKIVIE